jgi:hypothetical protein
MDSLVGLGFQGQGLRLAELQAVLRQQRDEQGRCSVAPANMAFSEKVLFFGPEPLLPFNEHRSPVGFWERIKRPRGPSPPRISPILKLLPILTLTSRRRSPLVGSPPFVLQVRDLLPIHCEPFRVLKLAGYHARTPAGPLRDGQHVPHQRRAVLRNLPDCRRAQPVVAGEGVLLQEPPSFGHVGCLAGRLAVGRSRSDLLRLSQSEISPPTFTRPRARGLGGWRLRGGFGGGSILLFSSLLW